MPGIYGDHDRAAWGALPPTRPLGRLPARLLRGLAVHHGGDSRDYEDDHEGCPGRVRAYQRLHQREKGWADLAYHAVICPHGVSYAGRPVGRRSAANGTVLANAQWLAVCVMGNSSEPGWRLEHRVSLALRACRADVLSLNPRAVRVWPHLRFTSTECPGRALREWCRQFP